LDANGEKGSTKHNETVFCHPGLSELDEPEVAFPRDAGFVNKLLKELEVTKGRT